ncbi:MAG: hypothetical protein WAL66_03485, partial [Nitrososphaeraceae archaeon]
MERKAFVTSAYEICGIGLMMRSFLIWIAIESESKEILGISVSKEGNMFIAERFISSLIKGYGKHSI